MMSVYISIGITTASAASTRDTSSGQWVSNVKVSASGSYTPDGSSYSTNVYKINGAFAYCLEPAKDSPQGNSVKLMFCEVGAANLKKAMYYYTGAGNNIKAFSYNGTKCTLIEYMDKLISNYWFSSAGSTGTKFLLIHYACAKLYGTSDWSYGLATNDWINAVTTLANAISRAENAPSDFVCYLAKSVNTSVQTLLFIPSNSVTVTKVDSNNNKKLSGATFRIDWYENDSRYVPRYTKTTGSNGTVAFSNLPPGKYRVTETNAPKGYANAASQYFTVSGTGGTGSVSNGNLTFQDNPYIKLQLLKTSANTSITNNNDCYSLEGAVYNVYTNSSCTGTAVGSIKTNKNGYGCFGSGSDKNTSTKDKNTAFYGENSGKSVELKSGITYYCKEVTAPKGYELDGTIYKFTDSGTVSGDNIKIYRAVSTKDNKSTPKDIPIDDPVGIVLQKKNAANGETVNQGLEGAVFQVQYFSEEIDKDYDITSGDTAPTLDSSTLKRTWYIQTDEDGFADFDENYILHTGAYLSDDFYYSEEKIITIPVGTIVIKEIEAPAGYTISDTVFYRRISEEIAAIAKDTNTPIEVPIDEQPAVGYIGINKRNNSGDNVAGASYGLYEDESCTTVVATAVTTKDGYDVFMYGGEEFKALIGKTYYIKEISAPQGYTIDTTVYPITPTVDNTTIQTALIQDVYEDSVKGNIIINKSSNDGVIKNLWFSVTDNLGNEYNAVCTDSNGVATVTGLPVYDGDGNKIQYTVKELGFKVTPGKMSYGGYSWVIKAENCINYKGIYYEGLASYSRYLYGDIDGAFVNFEDGYTKELTANKNVTYEFVNTAPTVEILINKNSYDGAKKGFWFRVEDQFGNSYGEICTDSNGSARLTDNNATRQLLSCLVVPYSAAAIPVEYRIVELGLKDPGTGEYYLPERYNKLYVSNYYSTEVIKNHQVMDFDVYNSPDIGSIEINKSSDDGVVSNLCFSVQSFNDEGDKTALGYDKSGNPIYSFVMKTNKDGYAISDDFTVYDVNGEEMNGLPVYVFGSVDDEINYEITELGNENNNGTYTFPSRYINNEPVRYNLLENRNIVYKCHNTTKTAKLQICKTSDDGLVDEIWFNVKCDAAGLDVNVVTDSSGYSEIIENLQVYQAGTDNLLTYTVTELGIDDGNGNYSIPSRYTNPKVKKVTLDEYADNNVTIAAMHNTLKNGSVTLYKKDDDGNSLSGSVWKLYSSDGNIIHLIQNGSGKYFVNENGTVTELPTNASGELIITDLPQGDYYLIEIKTPNGFMSYGNKVDFTISTDSGETLNKKLTVKDHHIVMYNTGGNGTTSIYIVGVIMAVISLAFIAIAVLKLRKKHSVK